MADEVVMEGVREWDEGLAVSLIVKNGREYVRATNEGGHNSTAVDLRDLVAWLAANRPDLLAPPVPLEGVVGFSFGDWLEADVRASLGDKVADDLWPPTVMPAGREP